MSEIAREYTGPDLWWHLVKLRISRAYRRYVPIVVWPGQEVDIRVTFTESRLIAGPGGIDGVMSDSVDQLNRGALPKIERELSELGISFDTGLGPDGRDWEWDYSLDGPIHVAIVGRKKPNF